MSTKLIFECDLCGKTVERFPNMTQNLEAVKPAGWCNAHMRANEWTGEPAGVNWYCGEQCNRGYLAAHEAALSSAKTKAVELCRTEFQAEMKRAKLVSRNAVDALAGIADTA